jgi:hypothetical protein
MGFRPPVNDRTIIPTFYRDNQGKSVQKPIKRRYFLLKTGKNNMNFAQGRRGNINRQDKKEDWIPAFRLRFATTRQVAGMTQPQPGAANELTIDEGRLSIGGKLGIEKRGLSCIIAG